MVFVTPAEGARVRMPDRNSTVMDAAGAWVARTVHYESLIQTGDVIVADPQPDLPGTSAPAAANPPARHRTHKET